MLAGVQGSKPQLLDRESEAALLMLFYSMSHY